MNLNWKLRKKLGDQMGGPSKNLGGIAHPGPPLESSLGVFHKNLSTDELMVPYRGLRSAKQFIKGKPVKFGHKMWMLSIVDGFPYNFDIYCSKRDHIHSRPHSFETTSFETTSFETTSFETTSFETTFS